MSDFKPVSRGDQLDAALGGLMTAVPEVQAAAVVSFDGLPMASVLPPGMDEDRVAAMSAALLSLGERASQGLGRGELSQVFVEGEHGTVFLVSCESEAVLVVVAVAGAKKGLLLYEIRRSATALASILRDVPEIVDDQWPSAAEAESDIFAAALADAEAAYQAHRSASWQVEPQPADTNVVYTPVEPAERPLVEPTPIDPADWSGSRPATHAEADDVPSWLENPGRYWDVR